VAVGDFYLGLHGVYNSNVKELITSGCFTVFNEHVPMWKVSLAIKYSSFFKHWHLNSVQPFPWCRQR